MPRAWFCRVSIEADSDVEILDPNCTSAPSPRAAVSTWRCTSSAGRGYVSADKNFDADLGIGFIPVDSIHSPVRKVNYIVEAARLGQITDYDKLSLEIWTNGTILPADALGLSAKLLKDHMTIFINFEEEMEAGSLDGLDGPLVRNENLNRSVEELELSVRSYNCLKNANIAMHRRADPEDRSRDVEDQELRPQVPERDQEILAQMGLSLGMKIDDQNGFLSRVRRLYSPPRRLPLPTATSTTRTKTMRTTISTCRWKPIISNVGHSVFCLSFP